MDFDLIVIGSGPAGYTGAIRAAQLGMKVACIEKGPLGGTCLNVGCIPSKVMLSTTERHHFVTHHGEGMGLMGSLKVDVKKLHEHKETVVKGFNQGVGLLFKKNKVTHLQGSAVITGVNEVTIGKKVYSASKILIATGSKAASLPGIEIDEDKILSNVGALDLTKAPKSMVIVGGGVIGLELGSVWSRLGTRIDVIEFSEGILGMMDAKVAKDARIELESQGLHFHFKAAVKSTKAKASLVEVVYEQDGETKTISAEKVLMAVGRIPYTENLGLEKQGVQKTDRGFIPVNENYQTNVPSIYAVGDVIGGMMLAHKAEEEAVVCVEHMTGMKTKVHYNHIPSVVYTDPEIATVGYTEQALKDEGIPYVVGKFPFIANSRLRTTGEAGQEVRIFSHKETDQVLGATIVGPSAGELIHEVCVLMAFGGSSEDLARTTHAHPSYSEAIKEAALAVDKRSINS